MDTNVLYIPKQTSKRFYILLVQNLLRVILHISIFKD